MYEIYETIIAWINQSQNSKRIVQSTLHVHFIDYEILTKTKKKSDTISDDVLQLKKKPQNRIIIYSIINSQWFVQMIK